MSKAVGGIQTLITRVLRLRIVRAALMFSDHRGGLLAAAVTFRALFAVFAAVLLGFSAASLWLSRRSDLWDALIEMVNSVIPGLVGDRESGALIDIEDADLMSAGVGLAGVASILALVWALVSAVGNLRMSVRSIAGTRHESGSALLLRVRDLLFALSIGVLLIVSAVLSVLGSTFIDTLLDAFGWTGGRATTVFTWLGTVLIIFVLDAVIVGWLFWLLSGVKAPLSHILPGALVGAAGLVVLQQASSLFVGGATSNPLLAGFASLIALLLWFNLSAQVILIACAYIVVTHEETSDRVGERYGADTFKQRAVRTAQRNLRVAEDELLAARDAEREERTKMRENAR
ncbi:YihY/virulence factor BrkB family protein [Microbacterium amylolyticum]|uniref:Membrane protein n=1 Tax=Microbacterium amylolyticum TaxID=936337 RepID=A0ABS4ZGB4_9MICO|nr:YihY/virulence factor BrkB family protein [Microbacterium amylolyticum]MBP2436020.1 membrane protein [Microbacterium amylolyticum]